MIRRTAPLAVLAALVLALAACGGDDDADTTDTTDTTAATEATDAPETTTAPDGGGATTTSDVDDAAVDACSLVTAEEAAAIVGAEVGAPEGAGSPTCRYPAADSTSSVVVEVTTPGGAEALANDRELLGVDEELAIGDGGFRSGAIAAATSGDTMVAITGGALGVDTAAVVSALGAAIERLP